MLQIFLLLFWFCWALVFVIVKLLSRKAQGKGSISSSDSSSLQGFQDSGQHFYLILFTSAFKSLKKKFSESWEYKTDTNIYRIQLSTKWNNLLYSCL